MKVLWSTHRIEENRQTIEKIALQLGQRKQSGGIAFGVFLTYLADRSPEPDLSSLALQCLRTCVYSTAALKYLKERGNSEDTYNRIKAATVSRGAEDLQRDTLDAIRARINKEKLAR